MDDDEKLVEKVAREIVEQHGTDAPEILRERAELADACSDILAAEIWRDIADAAERIMRESRSSFGVAYAVPRITLSQPINFA